MGDLTSNGYDSFVIGAPTVGSTPSTLGSGIGNVYVIFGSATVTSANAAAVQNWLNTTSGPNYSANDRVGDLATLGAATQSNPISKTGLTYPFSGLTFTGVASLGASVAGVTLSSGTNGIILGAPNANSGAGAAYLVYGSFTSYVGKTIDVTSPAGTYPGLTIVTITNGNSTLSAGGQLGFSVAGGSNILGDGAGDVIIGAPARRSPRTRRTRECRPIRASST